MQEKKQKEQEEREMQLMLSKRQKTEEVPQSPMRGDGTPNKSLNASFSKLNAFQSNIYGGLLHNNNSRLNLSNFLFDGRFSNSILGTAL
jgi:hypothetical protein